MLAITDFGCKKHNQRQLALRGLEAELMENILFNLPSDGRFHTFICAHGHTHRLSFHIQLDKSRDPVAMFA
jgi:hypothetical protein